MHIILDINFLDIINVFACPLLVGRYLGVRSLSTLNIHTSHLNLFIPAACRRIEQKGRYRLARHSNAVVGVGGDCLSRAVRFVLAVGGDPGGSSLVRLCVLQSNRPTL